MMLKNQTRMMMVKNQTRMMMAKMPPSPMKMEILTMVTMTMKMARKMMPMLLRKTKGGGGRWH